MRFRLTIRLDGESNINHLKPQKSFGAQLRAQSKTHSKGLSSSVSHKAQSGDQLKDQSDTLSKLVFNAIGLSELSISEIAQETGLQSKSGSFKRKLLALGLIEYTIPDKPTSRLQKYRLTGKNPGVNRTSRVICQVPDQFLFRARGCGV